uniref:Uncharacterized protein n=1 Tax=Stomoxys calcitrans TaxID=35570 RepID=A0A1I8QDB7_STOCA
MKCHLQLLFTALLLGQAYSTILVNTGGIHQHSSNAYSTLLSKLKSSTEAPAAAGETQPAADTGATGSGSSLSPLTDLLSGALPSLPATGGSGGTAGTGGTGGTGGSGGGGSSAGVKATMTPHDFAKALLKGQYPNDRSQAPNVLTQLIAAVALSIINSQENDRISNMGAYNNPFYNYPSSPYNQFYNPNSIMDPQFVYGNTNPHGDIYGSVPNYDYGQEATSAYPGYLNPYQAYG